MKAKKRNIRMQQRITQKNTLKYILAGSSLLLFIFGGIIYFNFSQNTDSLANKKENIFTPTLRTTNINVPTRLLRSETVSQRLNKTSTAKGQNRILISRSTDEIVITNNNQEAQ